MKYSDITEDMNPLQKMILEYLLVHGSKGRPKLSYEAGVSIALIERVRLGHIPKYETIVKLLKIILQNKDIRIPAGDIHTIAKLTYSFRKVPEKP